MMCYAIDWIPKINIDGIEYNQDKWAWWNGSWGYKQEINISNTAGAQTNYPVKIDFNNTNVGTNWNWSNNGSDLRFFNSSNGELDFWIEKWSTTSNESTVWVEVDSLVNNGNTSIYVYYGNPSASSASDGDNTFPFFDDFNDGSVDGNKWLSERGSWTSGTNLPTVRCCITRNPLPYYNGNIYLIGGWDSTQRIQSTTIYNVSGDSYGNGTDYPVTGIAATTHVLVNDEIFLFGGVRQSDGHYSNWARIYNITSNSWRNGTNSPWAAEGMFAAVVNDKIYVGGGCGVGAGLGGDDRKWNVWYEYDPVLDTWTQKTNFSANRANGVTAVYNDKIYLLASTGDGASLINDTWEYNYSTDTWNFTLAQIPTSRSLSGGAVYDGKVYISAGKLSAGVYTNSVEAYDFATNTWTTDYTNFPATYGYNAGTFVADQFYSFGGWTGAGAKKNNLYIDNISIIASVAGFSESSGSLIENSANAYSDHISSVDSFSAPVALRTKARYNNGSIYNCEAGFFSSTSDHIGYHSYSGANDAWDDFISDDSAATYPASGITYNDWRIVDILANSTHVKIQHNQSVDETVANVVSGEKIRLGYRYDEPAGSKTVGHEWDWILTRKYVTNEPSVSNIGAEESAPAGGNNAPNITSTATSPVTAYTNNILHFNGTCEDADSGDNLTGYCQIYNGSNTYGTVSNLSVSNGTNTEFCNVSSLLTVKGESWKAELWCGDGTDNSSKVNTSSITIQNSVPVLAGNDTYGEVTPDSPPTDEDIHFNITCTDIDVGENLTGYVQLYNGSSPYGSIQNSSVSNGTSTTIHTLSSTYTAKGETWTGEYWCGDGTVNTSKQNDSVTIVNTAPTDPTNISGFPDNLYVGNTLSLTASGGTDVDNDAITYHYKFYNTNHSLIVQNWSSSGNYTIQQSDAHDIIRVYAKSTTSDANSSGSYYEDDVVENSVPTTPTDLSTDDNKKVGEAISASCTDSTDADGDAITYYYEFYNINDASSVQTYSTNNSYTVQLSDAHDNLRVRCKAGDGYVNSSEDEVNVSINNSISVMNSSRISPTSPTETDTLIGYCNATDADHDNITYYYRWYRNGALNVSGSTSSDYTQGVEINVHNITSGNLTAGDNWTLSCLANDGSVNSTWLNSSQVAISQSSSSPVMNSSRISPTTAYTNDTLLGYCNATDGDGNNLAYYWRWYKNGVLNSSGQAISGYQLQEDANSTACQGSWWGEHPCSYTYDGDLGTWGCYLSGVATVYFNYSKISNSVSAIWKVKDGYGSQDINIPPDCWNYSSSLLRFKAESYSSHYGKWYCYNGTWKLLRSSSSPAHAIYEERINWSFGYTPGSEVSVVNLSSSSISRYEQWTLSCRAFDGSSNSSWLNSSTVTIQNIAPSSPSVNNPSDGATKQSLSVNLNVTVSDIDSDSMNVSFYNNATGTQIGTTQINISSGSTAQVTWSGLSPGTTYHWYVNSTDGLATTQGSVWSFTTSYTPVMNSSRITPTTAYTNDTLVGYCNATDADDDRLTFYYNWYKNGNLDSSGTSEYAYQEDANDTNAPADFIDGVWSSHRWGTFNAQWNYSVPNGATNNSLWQFKRELGCRGAIVISNYSLASCMAINDTNLNFTGITTDENHQAIYCNGILIFEWDDIGSGCSGWWRRSFYEEAIYWSQNHAEVTLGSSNTTKGDNWTFSCRAYDGTDFSSWLNSTTLTISNSLPSITNIQFNSPVYLGQAVVPSWTFTDTNNDNDTSYYKWYLNGVLKQSGQYNSTALSFSNYSNDGDNITFAILGNDGEANASEWINSSVIIQDVNLTITVNSESSFNHTMGRNISVTFVLDLVQDQDTTLGYNVTDNHNASFVSSIQYNETDFNATNTTTKSLNVTLNSSDVLGNQSFNITVTRTTDNQTFNFTLTITVSMNSAELSISPLTDWLANIYSDESITRQVSATNDGYNASGCGFYASDSLDNKLSHHDFNLSTNETKNFTLTVSNPPVGLYSGTIIITCTNGTDDGFPVSSAQGFDYIVVSSARPSPPGGGTGGGGSDYDEEDIEEIVEEKIRKKGFIQFSYPGHTRKIPYLPTADFYKEVIIKAIGGPVENATVRFGNTIAPYFTGGICDLLTTTCYENITIQEDEEKYIFILGNLSHNDFTEEFLENNKVEGFVQVASGNGTPLNQYNLSLHKSKLFEPTKNVMMKINHERVTHRAVYYSSVAGIIVILALVSGAVLRVFGLM